MGKHSAPGCLRVVLTVITGVAILVGALLLAGCGTAEANRYNLPSPSFNVNNLKWERIWSPKEYATIMFACFHGDGIYDPESSGGNQSITVIGNDKACR